VRQLIVNVIDVNDNAPMFPLSQYIVQGIAETIGRGTDIIQGNLVQWLLTLLTLEHILLFSCLLLITSLWSQPVRCCLWWPMVVALFVW